MRLHEFVLVTTVADNDNSTNDETHGSTLPGGGGEVAQAPGSETKGDGFSVATLRDGVNDADDSGANQNDLSYGNYNVYRVQKTMSGDNMTFKGKISASTEPDNSLTEGQFVKSDVIMLVKVN
tara:strand:- start:129 stop:497 length:369 start_codon:yes stop_codon:yes gene_type:complete